MKLKDACYLEESYDQPRQHTKKQSHYFANKGLSSQSYGLSSSHVWMWELDHKEGWAPKNWCFWTMVLEKTLQSPLDCKKIQPVHPKGNQSWIFIGRTDAEAETPVVWPPDVKSWLIWKDPDAGKDWRREEKGKTEDEMVGAIQPSLTWWTWVWASSGSCWWTGSPGMLQSVGLQRVGHDWVTELNINHRIMKTVSYPIQFWTLFLIHSTYYNLYLLFPNSQSIPPSPFPLGNCSLYS